jgi:signal transduction histidine kinase
MRDHAHVDDASARDRRLPAPRDVAAMALWGVVWVGLWQVASILSVNYGISAWYPPAAVSLFLLIRYGPPAAPAIFLASLLAGMAQWRPYPGLHEVLGSLGHALAYLAAATLYRRQLPQHGRSIRPRSVAWLVYAALVGAVLAAVLGNVNIYAASAGAHALEFGRLFAWITGDFFGVISLCPVLLFVGGNLRWSRAGLRAMPSMLKTPLAALAIAVALASTFGLIARGSDLDFRLLCVVGVGVYSVIVAEAVAPRSAVIYLFFIAAIAAAWLSTEVEPAERVEFAVQICTFLVASLAMIHLSMDRMRARVAVIGRRLRIRDLSEQRDALSRRIGAVEAEFAQLAHEFKTPLGGIIGLLEITEGDVAAGDPRAQVARYFRYMRGCALYLNAMVDDAFDVTRIARGQFEPVIGDFEVADMLDDLALISRSRSGGEVAFPDGAALAGVSVRSDRNRLLQILVNLVVNGVRYADRGGAVRVGCAVGAESVTLWVQNPSGAISKTQIDAYLEGGHGVAANSKGLGIGLPLVGRLAAGIGAQVATAVENGVVRVAIAVPRA